MKPILLTLPILLCSLVGHAQAKKDKQPNVPNKKSHIENLRKETAIYLEEGDTSNIKNNYSELAKLEDELHLSLFYSEKALFYYNHQDFHKILSDIGEIVNNPNFFRSYTIYPDHDHLLDSLQHFTNTNRGHIIGLMEGSQLSSEERDVLLLNLDMYLLGAEGALVDEDSLNRRAEAFMAKYPESQFLYYVNEYIWYDYSLSPWALSFTFPINIRINSGGLQNSLKNGFTLGLGIDAYFYRVALLTHIALLGGSGANSSIGLPNTSWADGTKLSFNEYDVSLGFVIIDSHRFRITPFAGYNRSVVYPVIKEKEEHPEYKGTELAANTFQYGISIDFLAYRVSNIVWHREVASAIARLKYTYMKPTYTGSLGEISGESHRISISFGLYSRALRRNK